MGGEIMKKMIVDMALGSMLTIGVYKMLENKEFKKMMNRIYRMSK